MPDEVEELLKRARAHIAAHPSTGRADIMRRARLFDERLALALNGYPQALDDIKPGINAMTARAAINSLYALCGG